MEEDAVQTFCCVIENQAETIRNAVIEAPMDFTVVAGRQVSLRST